MAPPEGHAPTDAEPDGGARWLPALLVVVSLLPNLRAALPGLTYYFRDFTLTYYPLRAFFVSELRAGRWPWWNPYSYEGCAYLPMLYPAELVQALWPGPAFVSWLLTLHFPLAALGSYALARELGARRRGAFAAGAAFALGGLALSSLPLHWFLQALALAPWVMLTLTRAARRGGRSIVVAAGVLALGISTLAVEFVAQAVLLGCGLALAARPDRTGLKRLAGAGALALGLASLPIALMLGIARETLRGAGLGAPQLLDRPLPPLGLLQVVVPDLFGSIAEPLRFWWGGRVLPGGPYFMSLYLGPALLALAAYGFGALPRPARRVLAAASLIGLWYALGRAFGLAALLAPALQAFRFPVKALLLPYCALALACGFGVDRLASSAATRALSRWGAVLGGLGAVVALVGMRPPAALVDWLDISPAATALMAATLRSEGLQAAALGALVALLAWAAARGSLPRAGAAGLATLLVVADLARAGSGMNPQVDPAFFQGNPDVQAALRDPEGGRLYAYAPDRSPALAAWSSARPAGVERASFFLSRQLASPFSNVGDRLESAEGHDRLSFIPNPPRLRAGDDAPGAVARALPVLRAAGVSRIASLDALESDALTLRARVAAGPAGLPILVYSVADAWPRASLACSATLAAGRSAADRLALDAGRADAAFVEEPVAAACGQGRAERRAAWPGHDEYRVSADGPGLLVTRDSYTPSWRATLDGRPVPVVRVNGRHRGVAVPEGDHSVTLEYAPPNLRLGVLGTLLGLAASAALWARAGRSPA